jgi:hypothetical protein
MALKHEAVMVFISISVVLIVVSGFSAPAAGNAPVDGLTPTPAGNILFHDDFETYSNRWTLPESPKASVEYSEGALRVRIVSPGVAVWSVPDFEVPLYDFRVEVDAQFIDGGADSQFGFVLDYVDDEDFYAFVTMLDGEWLFQHQDAGEWIDLTDADAESVEFEPDVSVIHLAAEMIDGSLMLYLEDQLVGSVTDESLAGGLFGLFARAGKGYTDVAFDNIVVTDIAEAK